MRRGPGQLLDSSGLCSRRHDGRGRVSRKGRTRGPSDHELLAALDLLVAAEGIVKAGERLGVSYRTASNCHESRHVSRRMRDVLEKHLRERDEQDEQVEQREDPGDQATPATVNGPGGGEEPGLQESEQDLRSEVEALRAEVAWLRERVDVVERLAAQGREGGDDGVEAEHVNAEYNGKQQRSVIAPRRVFPELITEAAEPGEERVYGAAAELVVEWRRAWAERRAARYTLDWLRAERRRLELELRLVGEFGLTPPPADMPWQERRRERELDWRRRALRRLRWQLPITWGLHWLLRLLTLGMWGRAKNT